MSHCRAMCLLPLLSAGLAFAAERVAGETERNAIKHWDAPAISSPNWESHPAFDPRSGDLWFVRSDPNLLRPAEVDTLIGDPTKARERLGWRPKVSFAELVAMMVDADVARLRTQVR